MIEVLMSGDAASLPWRIFWRLGKIAILPEMTAIASILTSGRGWRVSDVICTAAAGDKPFEEQHRQFCIAAVTRGTFRYSASLGAAIMAPGAILLGNSGTCYECGHEHAAGDRCLSFHFAPEYLEAIIAELPGVTRLAFGTPRLPPLPELAPLLAAIEAARDDNDLQAFEELGLRLAAGAATAATGAKRAAKAPSRREEKRVSEAVRLIESAADRPLSLAELARGTATSPYHFLRSFSAVAGMTPYQFLLRTRLHRAAVRLRASSEPVAAIAFDVGFNDLSTFNRRFQRVMGATPSDYRRPGAAAVSDGKQGKKFQ